MAVKEKVRLCLDLSCLTLYWTCMYALNSLKSRWTLFTFSSSVMLFKKTLNTIFHSTLVQCMHVLICNRVFSATSWPVNTSSLVNSTRTVRKAFCKRRRWGSFERYQPPESHCEWPPLSYTRHFGKIYLNTEAHPSYCCSVVGDGRSSRIDEWFLCSLLRGACRS